MSPQTKKINGGKATATVNCPHADICAAPARQAEMMANVDQLGQSIGLLLETQQQMSERLSRVHEELLCHIQSVVDCNAYVVATLRKLGGDDA